jgi:dihydrofolate synthase/folylpolyglutamate synthase
VHTLREATEALYSYIPPPRGGDVGSVAGTAPVHAGRTNVGEQEPLEGTRQLLAALGQPQDAVRAAHVAGTSGKTSTAYLLRALLRAGGVRTGLTVSPHVTSITERVQVDGAPLAPERFAQRVFQFLPLVEATGRRPGYFELLVALAHWVFAGSGGRDAPVDVAVLETGIGGLRDRTNTLTRPDKLCLIADIGYDHTELLGDTVEEIAAHKAGIIQPGNHVLVVEQDERVLKVVADAAEDRGATVEVVRVRDREPGIDLPPFQWRNWSLARAAYPHLSDAVLSPAALAGAAQGLPPGRMEVLAVGERRVVLDGAHNPQKLAALADALRAKGIGRVPVLASLLRAPSGKLRAALAELAPLTSELIVPEFTAVAQIGKQTPPATEIAALARDAGIGNLSVVPDVRAGLAALLAGSAPVVLVTGSLYLVSQVREILSTPAPGGGH